MDSPRAQKLSSKWVKRSLGTRTAQSVEAEVDVLSNACRLLQKRTSLDTGVNSACLLHQREIVTGDIIGVGGFSKVREVRGIVLNESYSFRRRSQRDRRRAVEANCLDEDGQPRFVMKNLKATLKSNERTYNHAAADLVLEARLLACFNHPNIVKVRALPADGVGTFADAFGYFVIMDRLDETLSTKISRWERQQKTNSLPMSSMVEKLEIAYQLSAAIDYLHDREIVYRDLKPDNVGFLGNRVQLFDFGLAREIPQSKSRDQQERFEMSGVGTRRYQAPEVILQHGYNLNVDVYSLAMVLYEMVDLQKPYQSYSRDIHRLVVCEGGKRPPVRKSWPESLKSLLRDAWRQNPADRIGIKEVKARLRPMVDLAERELLSPAQRSARVIDELDRLFDINKTPVRDFTVSTVTSLTLSS